MKQITKFKRLLSGVLSAVMTVSAIPIVSAHADESTEPYPYTMFAASSDDGAITVNAGNFCVNGNVATNGTIVSSGNMNINGTRTEHANESMLYVLKKLNYSYFSGENVETYTEDYVLEDLNININNPIDVDGTIELTGNINLNSGIKAVDDVTINGEVKNSNNAVICSETGDINIETSNVSFNGLIYAPYGDIVIDSDNLNLNNVVIIGQTITIDCPNVNANYSSSMAELIGNESDIDVELYAMGSYNADVNAIDIEWFTNYTNSSYEVLYSDDNENYTSVATVTNATTYQYLITENFQKRYFKIALITNYGELIESIPFVVSESESGYEVGFLDSDEDGLYDFYELYYGTDLSNPDTDNDGLSDYQELYITGTNPIIYDSVESGISDADADSDYDGLTNIYEITIGTNPLSKDTDDDNINDYDEINIYNTDPLNPDSDGDGVSDGNEIILGLDPLNTDTNNDGTFDGDELFLQSVSLDRFDQNLFDNNLAVPSLEVLADANINSNIIINEYNGTLKGEERAYVGKVIEIVNADITDGTISFTLDEIYTVKSYTVGQIETNGLLICYYDGEDTVPLETEYDDETRMLTAEIDSSGIYFVVDVISWLDDYGIDYYSISNTKSNQIIARSLKKAPASTSVSSVTIKGQVDIVFVIDTTGSMGEYINNVKNNINNFVDELEEAGIKPSFALVDYKDITNDGEHSTNTKKNIDGGNWFKKADDFKSELSKLSIDGGGDGPETAIDALEMARQLDLRTSSQKFFILVTDADYKMENNYGITSVDDLINLLIDDDINVSVVSSSYYKELYKPFYSSTGGVFADLSGNFKSELLSIANMIDEETNSGCWIALDGLLPQIVKLNEKPTVGSNANSDNDSLLDREELKSVVPTKVKKVSSFMTLLGLPTDYELPTIPYYEYYSNPKKDDTDGDEYFDDDEVNIYHTDPKVSNVEKTEINTPDFIKIDSKDATKYNWSYYGTGQTMSYGGRQNWFDYIITESDTYNNESYGRDLASQNIAEKGCGLISSADSLLYICRRLGDVNYATQGWYQDEIIDIDNYAEYIWFMESAFLGVDSTWGLIGTSMASGLNRYYYLHDLELNAKWGVDDDKILTETEKMIRKDIPVTLSIGPYAIFFNDDKGVYFYIRDEASKVPSYEKASWFSGRINDHYVTVTGVIKDDIIGKTYLQISSWGEMYYIDYDEYLAYIDMNLSGFTNILKIS